MSTFTLKSIVQRGSLLVAVAGLVTASIAPAAFADALNPLTERSLLLSSSAPGWQDTDGSGYSTASPNPGANGNPGDPGYVAGTYAPAGSGANGRKTGETFSFRISTAATAGAPIHGFSLQYCQEAAGNCKAPGNNSGDARTSSRKDNAAALADKTSDLDVHYTHDDGGDTVDGGVGGTDYKIYVGNDEISDYDSWEMHTSNLEDTGHSEALTGKNNYITLSSSEGITDAAANEKIRIVFLATENNYITNPGTGSFFVKMNTYNTDTVADITPTIQDNGDTVTNPAIIDGGVTVANVMADSIHITTKVLETMQFSVGTQNPDLELRTTPDDEDVDQPDYTKHAPCEVIGTPSGNRIDLGNQNAEFSLQTDRGYAANSYWRLSSNSSGGATVYYSGETLTNTVGDIITPMPTTATTSLPGSEQFGLAFQFETTPPNGAPYLTNDTPSASFQAGIALGGNTPYRKAGFYVLTPSAAYANGDGELGLVDKDNPVTATAQFAFDRNSLKNPVAIADNVADGGEVLTCETAKMRYVANIAADTPAGVYTTKINYLAAPQY